MADNKYTLGDDAGRQDRQLHQLHGFFDDAYALLEPFLDPGSGWSGHSRLHLAFRVVQTRFSHLDHDEVHALIAAAHRTYIERNPATSDHLPRAAELPHPVVFSVA